MNEDSKALQEGPRPHAAEGSYWRAGELIGATPSPSDPWSRVLGLLMMIVLLDFALGLGPEPAPSAAPETHAELESVLAAAAEDASARSLLLIGDSVLAGDVMAAEYADWDQQRVLDHMRTNLASGADAGVHQLALDGLLPVDLEHVVAALDRLDPQAHVELVVELNLRYFSAAYTDQSACSREALCALAPDLEADRAHTALDATWQTLVADVERIDEGLHAHAPIHRRRDRLGPTPRLDRLEGLAVAPTGQTQADAAPEAEAEARVLEHYRSATIAKHSRQVEALRRSLARLEARGRKALLFVTPLDDDFAARAAPEPELGALHSALAGLVHELDDPRIHLVDLDHPLFVGDLFLDHCHLGPDGNRILALNLLHELSLPMRARPPEALMVTAEDFDQTLVSRVDRGYAEGAAWQALFNNPDGIDVSPEGDWIVVADTRNHVLRQLRGAQRVVELLAGQPLRPGSTEGRATAGARLESPRHPTIVDNAVVFIDGTKRDRLRVLQADEELVETLRWQGPRCGAYRRLRARGGQLYALCDDGRILSWALGSPDAPLRLTSDAHQLLERPPGQARAHRFEVTPDRRLLYSDTKQRIWSSQVHPEGGRLEHEPELVFANSSAELLPSALGRTFPFDFDEIGLANITDLRWVERYGALLVADEHPVQPQNPNERERLRRDLSERVHLRLFDLEREQVFPWVKPVPHGEAYALWNEAAGTKVSYWHRGSFALAQDDASLVWVERDRSRLFRLADGLLGLIKFGNRNAKYARVELFDSIANVAPDEALTTYAPQRFFGQRFDPFEREGPYLGVMVGSSLTTLVDRVGNYSLGRRLELELQRELGYRDGLRFDLFQRTRPAARLENELEMLDQLVDSGVALDVILVEVQDHKGRFFRKIDDKSSTYLDHLARLEALAARSGALVVLFDNSGLDADQRDGLRPSSAPVRKLLRVARELGFVVLEPSDRMLRDLLVESPWGTQPWGHSGHHGAPYAIDRTAEVLAALLYPTLRAHFEGREPAWRQPIAKRGSKRGEALAEAFEGLELPEDLPTTNPAYVQRRYAEGHLQVYVDLAGVPGARRDEAALQRVAAAALVDALADEAHGQLADRVTLTLVEFDNYDEYGSGVLDSANTVWAREFDAEQLAAFLAEIPD